MKNITLSGTIASPLYFKSSEITKVNSWFSMVLSQSLSVNTITDFKKHMVMNKKALFAFYKWGWFCKPTLQWQTVIWEIFQEEPLPSFYQSWNWAIKLLQLVGLSEMQQEWLGNRQSSSKIDPWLRTCTWSMPAVRGQVGSSWYKPLWSVTKG